MMMPKDIYWAFQTGCFAPGFARNDWGTSRPCFLPPRAVKSKPPALRVVVDSRVRWRAVFFLALVAINFLWPGCGQKSRPRPPELRSPPAVEDLSYSIDSQNVELSWTVKSADDRFASLPVRCKILRSKLSAEESNCEKCPIQFTAIGDIPIEMKRAEKPESTRMRFSEVLEPGYRYIYKVIVYDEDGHAGKDSNSVQFDY